MVNKNYFCESAHLPLLMNFMARENTTQGISFPPDLLAKAKDRAEAKGLSVSGYVQALIREDLTQPDARLTREVQEKILRCLEELGSRSAPAGVRGARKGRRSGVR
jgi:hypothetical protein